MTYSLRLKDLNNNSLTLTPDALTIISAGRITLPESLNGDNTYGVDIDLPTSGIPVANLGVIVTPVSCAKNVIYSRYIDGATLYYNSFYADSTKTYYTRNDANGVMTSFSAGNRTANDRSTWTPVLSVYPIAFWDKMGATTFSKVRLFASTIYLIRSLLDETEQCTGLTPTGDGNVGIPTYMNDGDVETYYGCWCYHDALAPAYSEASQSAYGQILFASANLITHVQIIWGCYTDGINDTNGSLTIQLYYNSAWNTIAFYSWGRDVYVDSQTDDYYGSWRGVTGIRCLYTTYCQKSSGSSTAQSWSLTREVRVYGCVSDDDTDNKLIYSIGSNGVSAVDYLIAMKRYNY